MKINDKSFVIVGLGLLGGSYAMGLTQAGCPVTAIDTDEAAIAYGLEHGIIKDGTTTEISVFLQRADCVVLALYPAACEAFLQQYQHALKPGCLVTDVCGVKGNYVARVQNFLRKDVEFIACHPMAGREVSGVQHANTAMFQKANFIVTPTEKNTPDAIAFAKQLGETLGFGRVSELSCTEHDVMIGYVSQLTHAIAMSLMNASDNTHLADYTGDSFRDLTRIARMNDEMWSELFLANRENLSAEIDTFVTALRTVQAALNSGDRAALQQLMRQSTQRRAEFDKDAGKGTAL